MPFYDSEDSDISRSLSNLSQEAIDFFVFIKESKTFDIQQLQQTSSMSLWNLNAADLIFFKNHSFELISNGNTLNIKITNLVNQEIKILGIARPMSDNKFLPEDIRKILVEKRVFATKYKVTDHNCGNLNFSLTDYFQKGSFDKLYSQSTLFQHQKLEQKKDFFSDCANNIQKMARKLQVLQQAKVFFPDAKAANWLLDDVIIADEKSLRTYDRSREMYVQDEYFALTPEYWPFKPRLVEDNDFENVHTYILGVNIYNYLTKKPLPNDRSNMDVVFESDVFSTDIGNRYKILILNLLDPNLPNSRRMGLQDAINELEKIKHDISDNINFGLRPEEIQRSKFRDEIIKLYPQGKKRLANRYLRNNADVNAIKVLNPTKHQEF